MDRFQKLKRFLIGLQLAFNTRYFALKLNELFRFCGGGRKMIRGTLYVKLKF